jgi:hypothetical protein
MPIFGRTARSIFRNARAACHLLAFRLRAHPHHERTEPAHALNLRRERIDYSAPQEFCDVGVLFTVLRSSVPVTTIRMQLTWRIYAPSGHILLGRNGLAFKV